MVAMSLKHNGTIVASLSSSIFNADSGLGSAPKLLKQVLKGKENAMWKKFVTQRGEVVEHDSFEAFVETPPLKGLGADMGLVKRIAGLDSETFDLLDQALKRKPGRPSAPEGEKETVSNTHGFERPATGTRARALRKLRTDAPELHEQVLAGNLSAHAAMVQAGFRKRTLTVPVDPEKAAAAIKRNFTKDQLIELLEHLTEVD